MLIRNAMWKKLRVVKKLVIEGIMLHKLTKVNHMFLADFFTSLCVLMISLASQLFFAGKKMQFINSLKNSWRVWLMQKSGKNIVIKV